MCKSVWLYVSKAIGQATQEYGHKLTKEELSELTKALKRPTDFNKDVIDKIINTANEILIMHGIHPGYITN